MVKLIGYFIDSYNEDFFALESASNEAEAIDKVLATLSDNSGDEVSVNRVAFYRVTEIKVTASTSYTVTEK